MDDLKRQELTSLLMQQRDLYVEMNSLIAKQMQCLADANSSELISLAARASQLKAEAEVIQGKIEPLKADWEKFRNHIPDGERDQLRDLMEEIKILLKSLLESMNSLKSDVEDARDTKADRLKNINQGHAARKGYTQLGQLQRKTPRHMDRDT